MSALATCVIVESEVLAKLIAAPREWSKLTSGATTISYGGSGYVVVTLLVYLDQQGIKLMGADTTALTEASGSTCIVFEPKHRALLPALDPANHDAAKLRDFYEAFNEAPGDGVEAPMLDGIRFLHDAVSAVSDTTVGLLVIA